MLTLPLYQWLRPASIDEVLGLLAEHPGECLLVAGGTDAVPNMKHRLHEPKRVVSLGGVRDLHFVREDAAGLHLGPALTLRELAEQPRVCELLPALAHAASASSTCDSALLRSRPPLASSALRSSSTALASSAVTSTRAGSSAKAARASMLSRSTAR